MNTMKKGVINLLILALVLVNLVLSLVLVFTFVPSVNKTNTLIDKICKIIDLDVDGEGGASSDVPIENLEYVPVTFSEGKTEQVFNLKQGSSDKSSHIKLSVILAINTKHGDYSSKSEALTSAMTYISGGIGDIVMEYTAAQANAGKKEMEQKVLKMLQEYFASDFIYDVSFSQFIIS